MSWFYLTMKQEINVKKIKKAFQPLIEMLENHMGKKVTDELIAQLTALPGVEAKAGGGGGGASSFVQVDVEGAPQTAVIYDTFQEQFYAIEGFGPQGVAVSRKNGTASGFNIHTSTGAVLYGKSRKVVNDAKDALDALRERFLTTEELTKEEYVAQEKAINDQRDEDVAGIRQEVQAGGFASRDDAISYLRENGYTVVSQ